MMDIYTPPYNQFIDLQICMQYALFYYSEFQPTDIKDEVTYYAICQCQDDCAFRKKKKKLHP